MFPILALMLAAAPPEPISIFVYEVEGEPISSSEKLGAAERITDVLRGYDGLEVSSYADLEQGLEIEAERQALGCSDASCMEELIGAMGAEWVVFSRASRLGRDVRLHLSLFDAKAVRTLARTELAAGELGLVEAAVARLVEPQLQARGLLMTAAQLGEAVVTTTALTAGALLAGTAAAFVVGGVQVADAEARYRAPAAGDNQKRLALEDGVAARTLRDIGLWSSVSVVVLGSAGVVTGLVLQRPVDDLEEETP